MKLNYRIGQIVPSSNTTMETEIPAMLRARESVLPERFTIASLRAPLPYGGGFAWFDFSPIDSDDDAGINATAEGVLAERNRIDAEVWLERLQGKPVLTIGEGERFLGAGGMIALVVGVGSAVAGVPAGAMEPVSMVVNVFTTAPILLNSSSTTLLNFTGRPRPYHSFG